VQTVLLMLAGRRNEIGLLAITTAVIMVGAICKWIASALYDRLSGQDPR
jgi:hypothetical protein